MISDDENIVDDANEDDDEESGGCPSKPTLNSPLLLVEVENMKWGQKATTDRRPRTRKGRFRRDQLHWPTR